MTATEPQLHSRKAEWQRQNRRAFVETHGYSTAANYATGGLREAVLVRDARKCVKCGLTESEHLRRWARSITNRRENTMENLQTLCLECHGRKDLIHRLRIAKISEHRALIAQRRVAGDTYLAISLDLGFSLTGIWKWCQKWGI